MRDHLFVAMIAAMTTATAWIIPAKAGDIQGDAYDCKELWAMRNQIYKAGGYCFKTAKTISYFGNAGCAYDTPSLVPMSQQDRQILRDIKKSEARQGC